MQQLPEVLRTELDQAPIETLVTELQEAQEYLQAPAEALEQALPTEEAQAVQIIIEVPTADLLQEHIHLQQAGLLVATQEAVAQQQEVLALEAALLQPLEALAVDLVVAEVIDLQAVLLEVAALLLQEAAVALLDHHLAVAEVVVEEIKLRFKF